MTDLFYDLHIHTALSPCAENEMTPNNITNMAALLGLNVIAVTDHNETGNAAAVMAAARENAPGLIVLPGMELTTGEEIHVVCLFDNIEAAEDFCAFVDTRRSAIRNKPIIFGQQLYMNERDEVIGTREELLWAATSIGLGEGIAEVLRRGGAAIPAHIDRDSNSVIASLGMIPPDLGLRLVEISSKTQDPVKYMRDNEKILGGASAFIRDSDAHNLAAISDAVNVMRVSRRNAEAVVAALRNRQ